MAIRTIYHRTVLTGGGTDALDEIDGNKLLDGDRAFLIVSGVFSVWYLDADYGVAENGTTIIQPDNNAGTKRWRKCT